MPDKPYIFDLDPDSLRELAARWGLPPYRADQVLEWVYRKQVADPARMTNISQADRRTLASNLRFAAGRVVEHQAASDGVQKLLIQWDPQTLRSAGMAGATGSLPASALGSGRVPEAGAEASGFRLQASGRKSAPDTRPTPRDAPAPGVFPPDPSSLQTECVMIPAGEEEEEGLPQRRTACVSSQVGCAVGCRFCASGLGGLDANLSAGQIVEQVWRLGGGEARAGELESRRTGDGAGEKAESREERVERAERKTRAPSPQPSPSEGRGSKRITHVVFMGMGEPLANFTQVTRAVGTLMAPWGPAISGRRITISTVGLPAQIRRLAGLALPVTLAISLHAPNDTLRRRLIPWAQYVTIAQLVAAGQDYFDQTGREVTLEYILLGGVNDRADHAAELATVARQLRGNVNLIRYNEVAGMPFTRPADRDVRQFQDILRKAGVNTHIRASRGRDIAAACGQLRHEHGG